MNIIKAVKKPIELEFMKVVRDEKSIKDLLDFGKTETDSKITKGAGGVYVATNEGSLFTPYGSLIARGFSVKLGYHFWPVDEGYFQENYKVLKSVNFKKPNFREM